MLPKKTVRPSSVPRSASRSPSPSMSARSGVEYATAPTSARPKGSSTGRERRSRGGAGVAEEDRVAAANSPTNASRSPSPSMSASSGAAVNPTSDKPKGLLAGAAKAGAVAVRCCGRRSCCCRRCRRARRDRRRRRCRRGRGRHGPRRRRGRAGWSTGRRRRGPTLAGVAEEERVADEVADERVEVAVAVDVGEVGSDEARRRRSGRRGWWTGRRSRCRGRAGVAEDERVAVGLADEGVEVAVAVDVGQLGRGVGPHIVQAEGVGGRGGEGRSDRRAGVPEEERVAEVTSPMSASRSPSPSMSARSGTASNPTSARPKGFVVGTAKAGAGRLCSARRSCCRRRCRRTRRGRRRRRCRRSRESVGTRSRPGRRDSWRAAGIRDRPQPGPDRRSAPRACPWPAPPAPRPYAGAEPSAPACFRG